MTHIEATELTALDIHPDGTHVRLNVRDQYGQPASIVLPALCANQLMEVLPHMVEAAMRKSTGDDALRLVHPLECFFIEGGATNAGGLRSFILTLDTGNGFWVSFTVADDLLKTLAETIMGDLTKRAELHPQPATH